MSRDTENRDAGGEKLSSKRPRKSGSEQRQKERRITFRMSPQEYATLEEAAGSAGLTLGSYIRSNVLEAPQTRQRRRPSVEVMAVTRLQGEMNRVGSNIHQILKRVNFGETPVAEEFHEALSGYREVIAAILETLGRGKR
jgi:hypothetical protein